MDDTKDALFLPYVSGGDVSYLLRVSSTEDDNLFSGTDIPSLTKQFTSLPLEVLHQRQDVPESTLFGQFSEDIHPPPSPASSILSLPDEVTQHTIPDDDLWQRTDTQLPSERKLYTWETFGVNRASLQTRTNPYLTEQTPRIFDELLKRHMNHIYSPNESGIVVDEYLFRESLLAVSVGRGSSLFKWSDKSSTFDPVLQQLRVTAISPAAAESVIIEMCRRGTMFRRLSTMTDDILWSPTKYGSMAVSFARAIVSITQHWQSQIQESYSPSAQGLLSLQSLFRDIDEPLFELTQLCNCVYPALGGELLSRLYEKALRYDYPTSSLLRALQMTLLQHTSVVFLDLLTYWIGFPGQPRGFSDIKEWYNIDSGGEFFVQRIPNVDIVTCKTFDEFDSLFQFEDKLVPGFIGREMGKEVFEMGFGLRLLWRCKPDHPLCNVFDIAKSSGQRMELRWLMRWDEIHDTHDRLDEYANDMWSAMRQSKQSIRRLVPPQVDINDTSDFGLFESKEAAAQMISSTMEEMSLLPKSASADNFVSDFEALHDALQSGSPIPLLSLIVKNSFTHALEIQGNLIQHALLDLVFSRDLRVHLSTLNTYFLCGGGIFVARLREALFEDYNSQDGRSGGQLSLGLNIGLLAESQVWPPSGAKVGLTLRNLIQETLGTDNEMSFGYRALSDAEFEKVKNPIGLEALDFLQLHYNPPFPLDAVITPSILKKYDRIFLFLLRLLRMEYVSTQLFRDGASRTSFSQGIDPLAQRFRIESHHFITAICGYMFHVSIAGNWHAFNRQLDDIQRSVSSRRRVMTLSELARIHARLLDKVMYCCLLKKSQLPILNVLHGTFEPILLFAKVSRTYARRDQRVWSRMREEMEDNVKILYRQFKKRAGMFVRIIDQLEAKGAGTAGYASEGGDDVEKGWFADLLVRLDGSYFER